MNAVPRPLAVLAVAAASLAVTAGASASPPVISGGSAAQRALLRDVSTPFTTRVPRIAIEPVRDGVRLRAPVTKLRAEWETFALGAAFADRSARRHLPFVESIATGFVSAPTSNAGPWPPRAAPGQVAAVRARLRRIARASGARITELRVSAPDAPAAVLRLRVDHAARFLRQRLRDVIVHAQADGSAYDGLFLEVDDARGRAWAQGETPLGGESYVRPGLADCVPFHPPGPARGPGASGC